jgi:HNH endonuclease
MTGGKPIILPTSTRQFGPWSRTPLIGRFEAKFIPEPNSGCWLWTGCLYQTGYGRFVVDGRWILAHRFSYQTYKGPLLEGLELDHLCRMRCCVNPDHLEQVTHAINIQRGGSRAKPTCNSGHPWTEENTVRQARTGYRQCRQCNNDFKKRARLRKKIALSHLMGEPDEVFIF